MTAVAWSTADLVELTSAAAAAAASSDWDQAVSIYTHLQARFPAEPQGWLGGARALRAKGASAEADALLAVALTHIPGNVAVLQAQAASAHAGQHWPLAASGWRLVLDVAPQLADAHEKLLQSLRAMNRLDEAQAALQAFGSHHPQDPRYWRESGHVALAKGELEDALVAFKEANRLKPNDVTIILDILTILSRQRRLDEMNAVIDTALVQFPGNVPVLIYQGFTAIRQRAFERAATLWQSLYEIRPHDTQVLAGYAETLAALKDEARMLPILDQLLARQPDNSAAAILYARHDMRHNRAGAAVARLSQAVARRPNDKNLAATLADAKLLALATAPEAVPEPGPPVAPEPDAPLLTHFESLGSGCEFGLLQRQFGAEPLGLLRWATINPAGLASLLEQRFAGIEDAEQNDIRPSGHSYELINHRYGMGMQTFISTETEAAETLLPKLCKRQRFLARKLSEDLTAGQRIMVYKAASGITEAEILRLWRSVRMYGETALLVVVLAGPDLAAGELKVIEAGLMTGAVGQFSNKDIAVGDWTSVCSEALSLWRRHNDYKTAYEAADSWR